MTEDFLQRARNYVREIFPANDGWTVQEKSVDGIPILVMSRRGQIAIAGVVAGRVITREVIEEVSALRDMNQAYLAIIYKPKEVEMEPIASSWATRLGVRVIGL